MTNSHALVIIGTGQAGLTLAREYRKLDAGRSLHLISADGGEVYAKPMLSNALAQGRSADALVTGTATSIATQLDAQVSARTRVLSIDIRSRRLRTDAGEIAYGDLVFAVGADPIRPPIEVGDALDVLSINDLDDYRLFRRRLQALSPGASVTVIGAGLIGLEFANDLAAAGYRVDVVDPASRALARLLPEPLSDELATRLSAIGVRWHFGTTVRAVHSSQDAYEIQTASGVRWQSSLVVSAVGLRARVDLANAAGLATERGIVVDKHLRASAPATWALGDCAQIGGEVRPFIMPIMHAARTLARNLRGEALSVNFPEMPVVLKTPAWPVTLLAPPRGARGQWHIQRDSQGSRAYFMDEEALLGFALSGVYVRERSASLLSTARAKNAAPSGSDASLKSYAGLCTSQPLMPSPLPILR